MNTMEELIWENMAAVNVRVFLINQIRFVKSGNRRWRL